MYLQSIGLNRIELVQAMGLLFLLSTFALWAALGSFGMVDQSQTVLSALLTVPALLGVWAGQRIRYRLTDTGFRRAVLLAILLLGLYLVPLGVLRLLG